MTIETTAIKAVALGNGAATVFPFTFLIPSQADLTVTLVTVASGDENVVSPTLYSVSGFGNPAGGSVTYPLSGSPLSSAFKIVIERSLALTQETDLQNQGAAYPADIEDALDSLTMMVQQLQDQINRSIVFSIADTVETTLPVASARANLSLTFNSNGDPVATSTLTPGTTVSAAMIPVVTAPTTAAALTALGIPGSLLDALIPAGVMWPYTGTTAPAGFLMAFGSACTPTYPVLRAQLVAAGSPFGTNGVDPLLPDLRSRSVVGKSNMGGVDNGLWTGGTVLGSIAGVQSVTLALANIPTGITSSVTTTTDLASILSATILSNNISFGNSGSLQAVSATTAFTLTAAARTATGTATSNNTSGNSHENRMPGLITNVIIKAH